MKTTFPGDRLAKWLLIVCLSGCRHASVQDDPNWPSPGPVDVASLPPIHSVINHGTTDPDALLASRESSIRSNAESHNSESMAVNPIVLGKVDRPNESAEAVAQTNHPSQTSDQVPAVSESPIAPTDHVTQQPPSSMASDDQITQPPSIGQSPLPLTETGTPFKDESVKPTQSAELSPVPAKTNDTATQSANSQKDISGLPPKEIDFEGLPTTAISAGRVAAKIGLNVITVYDLNIAIQEWIRTNVPSGQTIPRREGLFIAKMVLNQMIDRMLIVEEAHRMMKSEKQKEALFKQIDQVWQEQQIPPLLKKYKVDTPYELDQALKKQGRSLEAARKEFQDDAVAHEFMGMKLGSKTFVSLVDMRRYYNEHVAEYDRPAQLTWREIRIPIEAGGESVARQTAQAALDQIKSNADFATLAKRIGKGPTADQGGLWETSPGAFAIEEVNKSLETLQPGQTSGIIATSQALFIVKLESRREAGPARFDEVQTEIKKKLSEAKLGEAAAEYIRDLRKRSIIHTIFDDIPDPRQPGADTQVQRTATGTTGEIPVRPTPQAQQSEAGAPQSVPENQANPLPNLNPAGPIPPRGVMSGPAAPPL